MVGAVVGAGRVGASGGVREDVGGGEVGGEGGGGFGGGRWGLGGCGRGLLGDGVGLGGGG